MNLVIKRLSNFGNWIMYPLSIIDEKVNNR
jgi:hypothetical protein